MKIKKQILISLLGRTPQIVTETLYALGVQQHIQIEKLVILTTAEGKVEAEGKLLHPESGGLYRLIAAYPQEFENLRIDRTTIHVATDEIPDIRNLEDNQRFVDMLVGVIRKLTSEQNTVLHCSLAGGRKTMSVYLALALQFFGRPQDKLYHVLVSPTEFESNPDFYYPQPEPEILRLSDGREISTAEARIDLVEVPYVRLRARIEYLFGRRTLSFTEMVQKAQSELEQWPHLTPLILDTRGCRLIIGSQEIPLQPRAFALYWFFAELSLNRPDQIPVTKYADYFEPLPKGEFDRPESIAHLHHLYKQVRESHRPESKFEGTQQLISKIKNRIQSTVGDIETSEYYIISGVGRYADKKYGIKLDKSKITIV